MTLDHVTIKKKIKIPDTFPKKSKTVIRFYAQFYLAIIQIRKKKVQQDDVNKRVPVLKL